MGHGLHWKRKKHGYGISFPSKRFCQPLHLKGQSSTASQSKPQTSKVQNRTARRLVFIGPWFAGYVFWCPCTSLAQHAYWECWPMGCVLHSCQVVFTCIMLVNRSVWRWTANPQFPQIKFISNSTLPRWSYRFLRLNAPLKTGICALGECKKRDSCQGKPGINLESLGHSCIL